MKATIKKWKQRKEKKQIRGNIIVQKGELRKKTKRKKLIRMKR